MKIGGDRSSKNVDDRRGQTAARAGVGGGALLLFGRLLFSRTGRRFIIPIIVVLGGLYFFVPGGKQIIGSIVGMATGSGGGAISAERLPQDVEDRLAGEAERTLATTEEVWREIFQDEGQRYAEPTMVLYTGATDTACGFGQAATGPFYCPPDESIYIDLTFFRELETRFGAGGDFARRYVVAHEVGHHVQKLVGVLDWSARQKQRFGGQSREANRVQVRVELMADCLAGVWAVKADALPEVELERGDLEEAIRAAEAVGDDTLQRKAQGRVMPDSFTHGTSDQRMRWFRTGYDSGDWNACETREIPYERL